MPETSKPSHVESIKQQSQYLRGSIPAELAADLDHFSEDAVQLLKHHGMYQQDNRDLRAERKSEGLDRAYMLMVRTRIPGGKLTSQQLLAEMDLADELGNQTLRITSRQGLQLHGIFKKNVAAVLRRIHEVQLTTLGACGDVNRNVMCCPRPSRDRVHEQIQELADTITAHLAPRTRAYHEIWLKEPGDEQKTLVVGPDPFEVEPIYGQHYLPRKFKIGITLPHDNCIDVYTHDVGLIAVTEQDQVVGYNVLVGGGLGVTPSAKKTFPALGQKLCYAPAEHVLEIVTSIVKVQRDFGNRSDRKVARLKYLVAEQGIDRIRELVAEYWGATLSPPLPVDVYEHCDHMGWEPQADGRHAYGLNVENGRIKDEGTFRLKSALREICTRLEPGIRLTAHQSILLTDLEAHQRPELEQILVEHGVRLSEQTSNVRRWSMACVAWPTCGLSITEAERALPGMMNELEKITEELGISDEQFTVRMTGCPNGCARPYNADFGLVGKAKGKYTIFAGGSRVGTRLGFIYKDMVPEEEVVAEIGGLLKCYHSLRQPGESVGDFCDRLGKDKLGRFSAQQGLSTGAETH